MVNYLIQIVLKEDNHQDLNEDLTIVGQAAGLAKVGHVGAIMASLGDRDLANRPRVVSVVDVRLEVAEGYRVDVLPSSNSLEAPSVSSRGSISSSPILQAIISISSQGLRELAIDGAVAIGRRRV